ncbi:MAG: type III glutamate--ammonia ligase [Alphaproteobacteria bacterium]
MTKDLSEIARAKKINYFLVSFTDLFGVMRSKLVPAHAIASAQKSGAGFAGFATHLDLTPADPDMFAMPDPDSLIPLPWRRDVAWVDSDLFVDNKPLEHAPRRVLQNLMAKAQKAGFEFKTGVECEFFLLDAEEDRISDAHDTQVKPCYDQHALMRRYEVIAKICDMMHELGWGPYQNDHEDGNGQFEMNWAYANCMTTANCHAFFKFMVRSVAEQHGLRATFMPKPFSGLTGNGCHMHLSLWDSKTGRQNQFVDAKGEMGLSQTAYHFLGGVLKEASALCAITNPTVNSYKRINAPGTVSGSTWAPNTISYTGNNRTHMVRIPDSDRLEIRLPDGAANPYLLPAVVLAAGLDGMSNKTDPGKRLDINMYENPPKNVKRLPQTLHEALGNLDKSKVLRAQMGDAFVDSYVKLKMTEWNRYLGSVSDWERETYLSI